MTTPAAQEPTARDESRDTRASLWVSTTYFGEGFPYAIVNNLPEILFKQLGASLQVVGLTSLLHLPWNLKFLWGPLVDQVETKRTWLLAVEVALSALLIGLAVVAPCLELIWLTAACFGLLGVLSATHDIAIDGFYLEGLDQEAQSRYVGFRAMAYKVASLAVRGPLLIFIGWLGWRAGLLAASLVMALLFLIHLAILPKNERRRRSIGAFARSVARPRPMLAACLVVALAVAQHRWHLLDPAVAHGKALLQRLPVLAHVPASGWIALSLVVLITAGLGVAPRLQRRVKRSQSTYGSVFLEFVSRKHMGRIVAFVVLFRAGESLLQKMKWPFLRDDMGMTLEQYGFTSGTLGVIASFSATFLGGWLIARQGLRRWIWPFALSQNVLNLLYWALATWSQGSSTSLALLTAVIALENFGEGLGTAALMVYLMRSCGQEHKATDMAIFTALMSVSFTFAGAASGFLADRIGFGPYFGVTFLATLPGMALILVVPNLDRPQPRSAA